MNFSQTTKLNAHKLPAMQHGWQACAFMSRRAAKNIAIKSLKVYATLEEQAP